MSDNVTTARFMLDALKKEGVDHVFLVPGGMIDPFLPHFHEAGIEAIVGAHESGAGYMADGYARARGTFGVCMGIGGPGVTNIVTPLAAAYADRSRMLVIGGTIPIPWEGRGAFQDSSPSGIDDLEIMRPVTAYAEHIPRVESVSLLLKEAIRAMHGIENKPAFISLPRDVQTQPIKATYWPNQELGPQRIVNEQAAQVVPELLAEATRITILLGNGCVHSNARAAVEQFAERFDIPVVTTLRAKGAISEDHGHSMGVFGLAGSLQANKVVMGSEEDNIPKAEVLLVLGARLNQYNTYLWNREFQPTKGLVHVDINPTELDGSEYREIPVVADVRTFVGWLEAQAERFAPALEKSREARVKWIDDIRQTPWFDQQEGRESSQVPIHPARVVAALRQEAPANTVVVADSGAHTFFVGHHWQSFGPNESLIWTTTGPMGYAIGGGIGARLARPDQPCVAVVGDGSMLMHGIEIQTAARYGVPLILVVMNNSALGNVYLRAREAGPEAQELSETVTHDWVGFARSLGGDGMTVREPSELAAAFKLAFESKLPFVVDVHCDKDVQTPNTPNPVG